MGITKTYELCYSNSAKVNMGDYEQLSPFYSTKIVIEADGIEVDVKAEYERLRDDIDSLLRVNIENIKNAKKASDIGKFRFYEKNGLKYVSVTSVLNPEPKSEEDEERMKPYAARGTALHRQFESVITTGRLTSFTHDELGACAGVGGFTGYEFWFLKDTKFNFSNGEIVVFNDTEMYAGRYDAEGFYDDNEALFDLKTGSLDRSGIEKAFMQLAAYNLCLEKPKECLVIIPVSPKAKKEAMVIRNSEINKYADMFLSKRKEFKNKYGV